MENINKSIGFLRERKRELAKILSKTKNEYDKEHDYEKYHALRKKINSLQREIKAVNSEIYKIYKSPWFIKKGKDVEDIDNELNF